MERTKLGVEGLDALIEGEVEKNSIILVSGGTGTGKTNLSSQFLYYGAQKGENCLYISFEEDPEQIKRHVAKFGFDFGKYETQGNVVFSSLDVYSISRAVEAALLEAKGELMIKGGAIPRLIPKDFKLDRIVVDSLSALSTVFKKESYRYFVFNFFKQLKDTGATSFVITETTQEPAEYSRTGIEEFLGDGVIVLYNVKQQNTRVRALEILKLRGVKHDEKIVPFKITDKGIVVYPEQSLFAEIEK